ncbi:putative transmembrane protein ZNF593OS [Pelmatolapia mariae]|uniref:putative transmembrane protein ZNF593OS n=1 Tax=Pelmatolapia mariae TaxID=158779 RepID=UPI002FE55CAB
MKQTLVGLLLVLNQPSSCISFNPPHTQLADMIIRLGRLTPGYFRLLQRQVAGQVQAQPQDRAVNQIAMMLAIMGLSLSYYSAKQMTEKVNAQPAP